MSRIRITKRTNIYADTYTRKWKETLTHSHIHIHNTIHISKAQTEINQKKYTKINQNIKKRLQERKTRERKERSEGKWTSFSRSIEWNRTDGLSIVYHNFFRLDDLERAKVLVGNSKTNGLVIRLTARGCQRDRKRGDRGREKQTATETEWESIIKERKKSRGGERQMYIKHSFCVVSLVTYSLLSAKIEV